MKGIRRWENQAEASVSSHLSIRVKTDNGSHANVATKPRTKAAA